MRAHGESPKTPQEKEVRSIFAIGGGVRAGLGPVKNNQDVKNCHSEYSCSWRVLGRGGWQLCRELHHY